MKKVSACLYLFLLIVPASLHANSVTEDERDIGWQEIDLDDGVRVYKKEVKDTKDPEKKLIAVRGVAIVDAPIARVGSVVANPDQYSEWIAMLDEARYLKKNGEFDAVIYQHFNTPFVIKDRDFVVHMKVEIDSKNKTFVMTTNSVDDPSAPPPKNIRSFCHWNIWTLKSIDNGNKTEVEVKSLTDPNGSVPKWLVNWGQKKWPHDTIMALRKQVAKSSVIEIPAYRQMLTDGKK